MINFPTTREKYIYKYFTINEFLLKNLINNELYFSNPLKFNDPFDCQFELNLIDNSEAERDLIDKMQLNESEKKLFETNNLRSTLSSGLSTKFYEGLENIIGVACFSERPDNFLMWSHYANSHKGICLKFDWQQHKEYFQGTKVIYDNKLPIAQYETNQGFQNEIPKIVITKLKHWDYEDEIRSVVEIKNEKRNISFNPESLVGIIFGDKIEEENKKLVRRIVHLHGEYSNIKFYQADLKRNESKIAINELNALDE